MTRFGHIFGRFYNSAVVWSWAFNGFRLASGLLLLPLLLRKLPDAELGMYYVFLRLIALIPIIDFGFSSSMGRYVSYAMGGASELKPHGITATEKPQPPNVTLMWQLLFTYRQLYQYLSLAAFCLLGVWGTYNVHLNANTTASPGHTWAAWGITLLACTLEIYLSWWNVFLRGMNHVLTSARLAVLGYGLQLVVACILLLAGWGLMSVPIGGLLGSLVQRTLSRKYCLLILGGAAPPKIEHPSLLRTIWPNTWRVGLQLFSNYLAASVPGLVYAGMYGSAAFASYGVSMQVMTICMGMAAVWVMVKWPLIGQYQAQQDFTRLRQLLWPRIWLQSVTFVSLAGCAIFAGPPILNWIGSGKELLPVAWLALIALNAFLEMQFSFWTTLICSGNRTPYLWPAVATNCFGLMLFLALSHFFNMGVGALVLAPLLAGCLFNYWYWPLAGAKSIRTSLLRFTFARPRCQP